MSVCIHVYVSPHFLKNIPQSCPNNRDIQLKGKTHCDNNYGVPFELSLPDQGELSLGSGLLPGKQLREEIPPLACGTSFVHVPGYLTSFNVTG